MVYIDTLTGIYNRNKCEYLFSKFENDYTKDVVIISIDLNDFKYIYDTYGHQVGDKALCTFIDILKNYFPRETFIGRMGGDEFIVVLENISEYRINLMLDNMYNGIKEYNEKSLEKFKLSAAYGYAIRKKGKKVSIKDIYKKADENMYSNKYGR